MYKGALFFDYDGTLTDEKEDIFAPTVKTGFALDYLRRNGYATFLATGRMKPLTTLVSGKFTGIVTSNGAYVEIDGKQVKNSCFDTSLQLETIKYMREHNICFALETQVGGFTDSNKNQHFLDVLDHFKLSRSLYRELKDESMLSNKMIITYTSEKQAQDMADYFVGRLKISPHRFCLSADVDMFTNTKANGVNAVLKELGIPKENSYAFGDGSNDFEMLSAVGHGIAMGEHSKSLDSVAEYITKSVKEDGIYYALKEYCKIIK